MRDEELVRLLRLGAAEQFALLYDRHADEVFQYLFRRTANWADAEDMTSSVFLEAWRQRDTVVVDRELGLRPWLYGVAGNLLRNHLRAQGRREGFLARQPKPEPVADVAEAVAARLDEERRMRAVLAVMARLAEPDREILQLCLWEELRPASAAVALGITADSARQRLSRARIRLRALLSAGEVGVASP